MVVCSESGRGGGLVPPVVQLAGWSRRISQTKIFVAICVSGNRLGYWGFTNEELVAELFLCNSAGGREILRCWWFVTWLSVAVEQFFNGSSGSFGEQCPSLCQNIIFQLWESHCLTPCYCCIARWIGNILWHLATGRYLTLPYNAQSITLIQAKLMKHDTSTASMWAAGWLTVLDVRKPGNTPKRQPHSF